MILKNSFAQNTISEETQPEVKAKQEFNFDSESQLVSTAKVELPTEKPIAQEDKENLIFTRIDIANNVNGGLWQHEKSLKDEQSSSKQTQEQACKVEPYHDEKFNDQCPKLETEITINQTQKENNSSFKSKHEESWKVVELERKDEENKISTDISTKPNIIILKSSAKLSESKDESNSDDFQWNRESKILTPEKYSGSNDFSFWDQRRSINNQSKK